jgi:glutamine amidotransferase
MNLPEVTIIDYGVGNLLSVQRGLEKCGAKVLLSSDAKEILASQRVVLPGVGAFPKAMEALRNLNLVSAIQEFANLEKPLLAICLGMQLLMDESEEFGITQGLGLISGRVVPVPNADPQGNSVKIPHIGWNDLKTSNSKRDWSGTLLEDTQIGDAVYFVHSYMALPFDPENLIAHVEYGSERIAALTLKDKITGCQFHPEKSGEVGLKILQRFVEQ